MHHAYVCVVYIINPLAWSVLPFWKNYGEQNITEILCVCLHRQFIWCAGFIRKIPIFGIWNEWMTNEIQKQKRDATEIFKRKHFARSHIVCFISRRLEDASAEWSALPAPRASPIIVNGMCAVSCVRFDSRMQGQSKPKQSAWNRPTTNNENHHHTAEAPMPLEPTKIMKKKNRAHRAKGMHYVCRQNVVFGHIDFGETDRLSFFGSSRPNT